MGNYFEGWYLKHQKDGKTLCLIPGRSNDKAFIQVIGDKASFQVDYPRKSYHKTKDEITIESSRFSKEGLIAQIDDAAISLRGELKYSKLSPLKYDIMGPFAPLPMQCKHSVFSMNHRVSGSLKCNGEEINFDGGKGYWEGDRGRSFPSSYSWFACNDFEKECSVMVSIAKIPFAGFSFWGCIGFVWLEGVEHRFATYLGVKIEERTREHIRISQGKKRLDIVIPEHQGHGLSAPQSGQMVRTIHESPATEAMVGFFDGDKHFHLQSAHASYEFVK